jgi:two-component system nitrogen regulation sensor histidine kinase GlnL
MTSAPQSLRQRLLPSVRSTPKLEGGAILNALAIPVFVADRRGLFRFVNAAAEQFFGTSSATLVGRALAELVPADSPLIGLIDQVHRTSASVAEYDVTLDSPRFGAHLVTIHVAPMVERPGCVTVSLEERSIADKLDRQLTHRGAARSVTAMAAMLAHEVKNPLSGIRGAAQLLERGAAPADRELTRLICEEADRIVGLVDRMESFSDDRPIKRSAVNIHQVLEHVRKLAQSGFASGRRFVEIYDPSLPPVLGNRDLLVQLFLNLIKNAAEATQEGQGIITLTTRYRHGVRMGAPGSPDRIELPLVVTIEDNGEGIPADLQAHLFDPFVTTKIGGKGLGLALVAKIVGDHGGIIEFASEPRRTVFSVMLPVAPVGEGEP